MNFLIQFKWHSIFLLDNFRCCWFIVVNLLVCTHLWVTCRSSTYLSTRTTWNRRSNRFNNIEKEANICTMGGYFNSTMCMGYYHNTCHISIWLLHHYKSIANVYENSFAFQYQRSKCYLVFVLNIVSSLIFIVTWSIFL